MTYSRPLLGTDTQEKVKLSWFKYILVLLYSHRGGQ
jgi:hypothetical protein